MRDYNDYKELCIDLLYDKLEEVKEQLEEYEEKYDRLRIEHYELTEDYETLKKSIKADSLIEHEEDRALAEELKKHSEEALSFLDDDFGDLNEDVHDNIKKETIKKSRKSRDSFGRFKK